MRKVAVIHYQPLELYPPVMNFINCADGGAGLADGGQGLADERSRLADGGPGLADGRSRLADGRPGLVQLDIYTTWCYAGIEPFRTADARVVIHRLGAKKKQTSVIGRAWHYWRFYSGTLWLLMRTRPSVLLYFETISAFPAFLYKKYVFPKSKLFIHYHEYMTPEEYEGGMQLVKWFHRLEKKIYHKASSISHTNAARMQRFVGDMNGIVLPERRIFPNYPPRSWGRGKSVLSPGSDPGGSDRERTDPGGSDQGGSDPGGELKTVYIGAFSLDTMYVKEFATWVVAQQGAVSWDIYSLNLTPEARAFIKSLPGDWVKIHPGIEYNDLPEILSRYDVGLILYTGHVPNWVDNAPNKLFEYRSVGLDVWFPEKMRGSLPYVTTTTYPRVVAVNFQNLDNFDWKAAVTRSGLEYASSPYYCEDVYQPLWKLLLES